MRPVTAAPLAMTTELSADMKLLAARKWTTVPEGASNGTSSVSSIRKGKPSASDDLGERVLARLRSLVVIHRIGDRNDPLETAVEHAEGALSHNDLAGAVTALEALPPGSAAPADKWLGAARQHLAAADALDRLAAAATAQLAQPAAPAPQPAPPSPPQQQQQ